MPDKTIIHRVAVEITKHLVDQGKLIEAGFAAFAHLHLKEAADAQRSDMRVAYMAGADHLFSSIISMLDPGVEETPADLRRMDQIDAELRAWREVFDGLLNGGPKPS